MQIESGYAVANVHFRSAFYGFDPRVAQVKPDRLLDGKTSGSDGRWKLEIDVIPPGSVFRSQFQFPVPRYLNPINRDGEAYDFAAKNFPTESLWTR